MAVRLNEDAEVVKTVKDGLKILFTIYRLFRTERPLMFYSLLAVFCMIATVLFAISYAYTDAFPFEFYTFIGFWFFLLCGIILNGQLKIKRENVRLTYLSYPFINSDDND